MLQEAGAAPREARCHSYKQSQHRGTARVVAEVRKGAGEVPGVSRCLLVPCWCSFLTVIGGPLATYPRSATLQRPLQLSPCRSDRPESPCRSNLYPQRCQDRQSPCVKRRRQASLSWTLEAGEQAEAETASY